ncbi:MAG: helicase, partial [bacterium]
MILAPELMVLSNSEREELAARATTWVAEEFGGVVIITPSRNQADAWEDVAQVVQGDDVAAAVSELVGRRSNGPFAFPNRYDGIDLPGDSCRLLILDGLPRGTSAYDLYRAAVLDGSSILSASLAQRIEQGMGRGTRGGGDHCVVLLTGKDLVSWVSRANNSKLFTATSAAQLSIGLEVSERIGSPKGLHETMEKCLERSVDWVEFHAEAMADAATTVDPDLRSLAIAECERRFFALVRDGYCEKAIGIVEKFIQSTDTLANQTKGWLLELAAWGAQLAGDEAKALDLQQRAFGFNRALARPKRATPYAPVGKPSRQSEQIVATVESFQPRKGVCAYFEELADWLTPNATSNQFEESLRKLGEAIGFIAERPDHDIGIGPDVLWIMEGDSAWVIEAKSQKDSA